MSMYKRIKEKNFSKNVSNNVTNINNKIIESKEKKENIIIPRKTIQKIIQTEVIVENKDLGKYRKSILSSINEYVGKKLVEGEIISCELLSIISNKIIYENYYCRTVFKVEIKQTLKSYPKIGTVISEFKIVEEDEKNERCIVEIMSKDFEGLKVYINELPFNNTKFVIKDVKIINGVEEIVGG
jgi:hypothetical protein